MMASKEVLAQFSKLIRNLKGYDTFLQNIKVVSAGGGQIVAELEVTPALTNPMGTLHGGCSATLVDSISSWALGTKIGADKMHVSLDIHTTYLKSANVGDIIEIDAKTLRAGKNIANLEVHIRKKATGELLVVGTQTKYIFQPKKA